MLKKFFIVCFFSLLFVFVFQQATGQKKSGGVDKVIIIRHGEKPEKGENLNCKGLDRSLKLVNILHQKIGTPDFIYVPAINTGKYTSTARMYQTIVPFAVKYNLNVNTKYEVKDAEALVSSIQKKTGTVLIVWEHKAVQDILKALGVKNPPAWDDNDFDSMLTITFPQGIATLSKDKENITPSNNCP